MSPPVSAAAVGADLIPVGEKRSREDDGDDDDDDEEESDNDEDDLELKHKSKQLRDLFRANGFTFAHQQRPPKRFKRWTLFGRHGLDKSIAAAAAAAAAAKKSTRRPSLNLPCGRMYHSVACRCHRGEPIYMSSWGKYGGDRYLRLATSGDDVRAEFTPNRFQRAGIRQPFASLGRAPVASTVSATPDKNQAAVQGVTVKTAVAVVIGMVAAIVAMCTTAYLKWG